MAKKELTIYFDKDSGDLLSYPKYNYIEKPNYEFTATLKYIGHTRGQSSARMVFQNVLSEAKYEMFLKDFDYVVKYMCNGLIYGTFTFCKRGANYGIKLIRI